MNAQVGDDAKRYIFARVLDALLREDVLSLIENGQAVDRVPADAPAPERPGCWWKTELGAGLLWIPVLESGFMQAWRYREGTPVLGYSCDGWQVFDDSAALLRWLARGLDADERAYFERFAMECIEAQTQHRACRQAQQSYFDRCRESRPDTQGWAERFLHYDRLASYLDHPYYPTARAKNGFAVDDLPRYAPEFQPRFQLRWLAVPRALLQGGSSGPAWWPTFEQVGLDPELAPDHALVPVHPFLWDAELPSMLQQADLQAQVIAAPYARIEVVPTLSVRSLVLVQEPRTHIKLPLTIRTLGSHNIRTIKPSTIKDGERVQALLRAIAWQEPELKGRLLLTDESRGACVDGRSFLGYILREYPEQVEQGTLVSVAGLMAETPAGIPVYALLSEQFYHGSVAAFIDDYLELTFAVHLRLWLRYGIALESNQQNSMLLFTAEDLQLLLKDNDAPRIDRATLAKRWPALHVLVAGLEDQRIWCQETQALAQMFVTITLQLNVAPLIEDLAQRGYGNRPALYRRVVQVIEQTLASMPDEEQREVREQLFEPELLDAKYLLTAGTLQSKARSGAADINKFYRRTAPNFLREGA